MSSQKGNVNRSRPQKYQNHTVFKNDLHDKSHRTKFMNSIEVVNVCEHCKKIIEWKIKYKKYKALKAPAKCTICEQKTVKHAYHIICLSCAKEREICSKCGKKGEIIKGEASQQECIKLDTEFQMLLKSLPERKRRTFLRYMNQKVIHDDKSKSSLGLDTDTNTINGKKTKENETQFIQRKDLLIKLKSLVITEEEDANFDSDIDNDLIK